MTTTRWLQKPTVTQFGDMWYDIETQTINTWNGKDWISMEDFKRRFQIIGHHSHVDKHIAIIVNFGWWGIHNQEVIAWLEQSCPNYVQAGTTIQFESEEDLTLFAMRWCGGY